MKLQNKYTGEIVTLQGELTFDDKVRLLKHYNSLAELCKEWEDYKEPKEYWMINAFGDVETVSGIYTDDMIDELREIGNHFETKEAGEKVVKKFKALTRLENNGFKFKGWRTVDLGADKYYFVITAESDGAGKDDLDLLFGGKE